MKKLVRFVALLMLVCCFAMTALGCEEEEEKTKSVDLDYSKLSTSIAYSKAGDLMDDPQTYTGKTIKLKGTFKKGSYSEDANSHYFVCVGDETACCSICVVFTWSGHDYPDDFPKSGDKITVEGELTTFKEKGTVYPKIKANNVTF